MAREVVPSPYRLVSEKVLHKKLPGIKLMKNFSFYAVAVV